jgi:trehalose synthase
MATLERVDVQALSPARLTPVIGAERSARFEAVAAVARALLAGRTVLNVNSTATGGGVAEMLTSLLAYVRGAGIDTQWDVIEGNPEFFKITKRLHNHLYNSPGDGGALSSIERAHYEATLADNVPALLEDVRPRDIVLLHDPQTAGLAARVKEAGATVVWRCHVGVDHMNEHAELGWEFLRPYLEPVDAFVFSRAQFAPAWLDRTRLHVIPPSIDPFSAKNEPMTPDDVVVALQYVGILDGGGHQPLATFTRRDGSPGRIDRHADILQTGPAPPADAPLVMQASRWDSMKDMAGVMTAFSEYVNAQEVHLVLAGPSVAGVTDDPEGAMILRHCMETWRKLPPHSRQRIHLACVPMTDSDEAAAIVNALQRHSTIVTQKSIAEGFGLTVAEAMWKTRPVVASAVGGISDQIGSGEHGLLIDDPHDLGSFGEALNRLLDDGAYAKHLAENGRERALNEFLGDRHLEQYANLFAQLES